MHETVGKEGSLLRSHAGSQDGGGMACMYVGRAATQNLWNNVSVCETPGVGSLDYAQQPRILISGQ